MHANNRTLKLKATILLRSYWVEASQPASQRGMPGTWFKWKLLETDLKHQFSRKATIGKKKLQQLQANKTPIAKLKPYTSVRILPLVLGADHTP